MNSFLDFAGGLIYFVLSIVLFPLFLFTQFLLGSVTAYRQMRTYTHQLKKRVVVYRSRLHLPHFDLIAKRLLLALTRHS